MLPSHIKTEADNPKKFKVTTLNFLGLSDTIFYIRGKHIKCLYEYSFYSLDEYFELHKS